MLGRKILTAGSPQPCERDFRCSGGYGQISKVSSKARPIRARRVAAARWVQQDGRNGDGGRDGRELAGPVRDASKNTLEPLVLRHVHPESLVSTDEWKGYKDLRLSFRRHGRVNPSAEEWVRGSFHTNTIEGHWSQLKRSIRGTHVHVSAKHLWKYVSEFSYRRNMRHSHRAMFNRLVEAFVLPRLADS